MANKKTAAPAPQTEELSQMSPEAREQEAAQTVQAAKHLAKIEEVYGDGDAYNAERSVAKVQAHLGSSAEHFLRAGRELIRLKEHEQPGEFLKILDLRLGIAPRAAQKMMQAAAKFLTSDGKVRPLLADANAGSTKVIELLTLDDEDIESLEAGERVAGITNDDIANMSVTELRKALKAAREDKQADAELIQAIEESKTELRRDLQRAKRGGVQFAEEAFTDTLKEIEEAANEATSAAASALRKIPDLTEALRQLEVPAHVKDLAKRSLALMLHAATIQIGEQLAQLLLLQEDCFADYIDDAKAELPEAGSAE